MMDTKIETSCDMEELHENGIVKDNGSYTNSEPCPTVKAEQNGVGHGDAVAEDFSQCAELKAKLHSNGTGESHDSNNIHGDSELRVNESSNEKHDESDSNLGDALQEKADVSASGSSSPVRESDENMHTTTNGDSSINEGTEIKDMLCAVQVSPSISHNSKRMSNAPSAAIMHKKASQKIVHDQAHRLPQKAETRMDNFRPLGRMLHDVGLELVREQVYCDLIEIQAAKNANNKLEEREKSQLVKLKEAQVRLAERNAPYRLPVFRCGKCKFESSSQNTMTLHRQYGSFSRVDSAVHVCCVCTQEPGFSTRSATGFLSHLSEQHHISGRLLKKPPNFACTNCPYEHRNLVRIQVHMVKCLKKYPLLCNLQPLPGDCDIALVYRPGERVRPGIQPPVRPWVSPINPPPAVGQPSVRALLNSLRVQQTPPPPTEMAVPTQISLPVSSNASMICEICGRVVEGRDNLWNHFRLAHNVELSRATMRDQEPWMKCDVCNGRFWTYQGLSRHLLLAHNRAIAANYASMNSYISSNSTISSSAIPVTARCHLCRGSQTSNPLSHFSTYHDITLLEMYHAKLCCLCNRKLNNGRAFEEHMVEQHSDIFANFDVLRTVLQALTMARCFKSDDIRQGNALRHAGIQAASDAKPTTSQTKTVSSTTDTITKSTSQTRPVKRIKEPVVVAETVTTPVKTPEKPATAEEVQNLYKELADIGRPILRSMRHRLNTGAAPSSDAGIGKTSPPSAIQTVSDEIPNKKACIDDGSLNSNLTVSSAD